MSGRHRLPITHLTLFIVAIPASAWTFFCPDTLEAGGEGFVLLGEQLVIDEEHAGSGMIVGWYQSTDGSSVIVQCTGGTRHHDMSGDMA